MVIRLGHAASMLKAVRAHRWVTLLPTYVLDADDDSLRMIDVEGLDLHEPVVMVRRRDHVLSRFQEIAHERLTAALGSTTDNRGGNAV
ncbi:LysR substrate-binding domain-containing protein [Streptomyces sp. NEAU-174]|uniref:LysR substrate-binding domain-containing protein n=1 Tax=Streptomyces sp. NEAU-174 TaxID=3458254 RepID=UPI0040442F3D